MCSLHDAVLVRLDRLEGEYQAIRAGLVRVEERLDRLEERLASLEARMDSLGGTHRELVRDVQSLSERLGYMEKGLEKRRADRELATRAEVHELRARLEELQARLDEIERRLPR
jgi:chromosome segregation ATPase